MKIFQTFCRATWREGNRSWSLGSSTAPVWGNNKVEKLCSDWLKSWYCWRKLSYAINPLRKSRNARCTYIHRRLLVPIGWFSCRERIMIRPIMDSISGCAPIIFSVFDYNEYNTRCSDPTESGTNASGVFCPHCKTGIILPADSLQSQSMWRLDIRLLPMKIIDINLTSLHF